MEESKAARGKPVPNKRLKEAREQHGWTHKEVTDMLNLPDPRMVSRWERGLHTPRPRYRRQLAELFGKSLEELGFFEAEKPLQPESTPEYGRSCLPWWNVPPTFTSFLGREKDIALVCALLRRPDRRLITLCGPGGVGKTRLAIQIAREMREFFKDGVSFISLAEIDNPALVKPRVAEALGVWDSSQLSVTEQIKVALAGKQCLLILDNFEQLTQAALFLEELLTICQEIKVLVTSRSVLHLSAEYLFSVLPLEVPDPTNQIEQATILQNPAVALFIERAQAVEATFQVTHENIYAIRDICSHLDGLPLAIELAAARIKLLPPIAMLARLTQRFQLLTSGLRALPERQRTLYKTITWSYDLLTIREQWFFRQISVFAGGCTLEAVAAICGTSGEQTIDTFSLVAGLLDHSLLRQEKPDTGEPRFFLLESVQEYALERLSEHNEREARRRSHALYYLALVEKALPYLIGSQQIIWLTQLDLEKDNLRAAFLWLLHRNEIELALRFCEGFGKFCGLRGYWAEEWRWLQAALELPVTLELQSLRARILRRAGHLAYRFRNLAVARAWQEESIELSRKSGDQQNLAGALSGLGWTLYRQNQTTLVERLLIESVEVARASGNTWVIASSLHSLGRFMHYQSKNAEARSLLEQSIILARELADKESLARILTSLVSLELTQGNHARAAALARESFAAAQEARSKPILALVLDSLVDIAMFQKEYESVVHLLARRIQQAEEIGDIITIARKRLQLGTIALREKDFVRAEFLAQQSLIVFQNQGDVPSCAAALDILENAKHLRRVTEKT
ncbi:MAG TPA: tetratricopeptide repeat protein [Ktedonobacteraceae bacterium]|nr:tetratricopeptide repeat protein [Ktedonobacteraceae bacterium]